MADSLSLIPLLVICLILYLVGREILLRQPLEKHRHEREIT